MKANELRIGNLVFDRGGKPIRIDFFEHLQNGFDCKFGQRMFLEGQEVHPLTEYTDYANPIPLTEEWLLKFGFDRYEPNVFHWDINSSNVFITKDNASLVFSLGLHIGRSGISIKKIQYVHQLQNLYFALTGEELILTQN